MTVEIKVPPLPESVSDATLITWHKQVGEAVNRDENLVDLETDKVVLEVPAPTNGVLKEIKIENGTTVTSGELLAVLDDAAVAVETTSPEADVSDSEVTTPQKILPASQVETAAVSAEASARIGPAARRLIEEHNLDASQITGTGKDGRVTKSDVMAVMIEKKTASVATAATSSSSSPQATASKPVPPVSKAPPAKVTSLPTPAASPTPTPTPATPAPAANTNAGPIPAPQVTDRQDERVPMTRLRSKIAERMVEAQTTSALLTSFNEVDLGDVKELRAEYRDQFETKHGVRLGFMSFFVKGCIEALKKFPVVNASIEDNDIVYHNYFDIGIAVSTERGLMVPVLRNADEMSFAHIEQTIKNFAERARGGNITLDELTGGTFT
ncbi:MAG: dihydrolipoamide succinyltransferase, partial [Gammaproteobacteria bacterium]|nr:dihydrolipoamide succinyltransferase [Gammaproteobacteria bacterium]